MKIYVPEFTNNNCIVVRDSNTIRVYERQPQYNQDINYVDYYVNSSYLFNRGTQNFGQYSNLPTCRNHNEFTNEVFYRNDFSDICIIFTVLCIFVFLIPLKVFSRLFRRVRL